MNDRFKFRAWDKATKKIYNVIELCFEYDNFEIHHICLDIPDNADWKLLDNPDKYTLMQSTGLKDKNGFLIFEGDIINIWCYNLTKNQISSVKYCEERAAFTFDYLTDYGQIVPCTMDKTEIEVIGNIYENPELLEVNNADI